MSLKQVKVKIRGIAPLIMHNPQSANPLNKFSKELKNLSKQRSKTEEIYAEMSKIEWHAGLYVNDQQRLIVPSDMLEASIINGAKKDKLGKQFKSAVFIDEDAELIISTKYKVAADLWGNDHYKDIRGMVVSQARVMRTRPIFHEWECEFVVNYDNEQVELNNVEKAIRLAGSQCGIGTSRPKYGRFEVVE